MKIQIQDSYLPYSGHGAQTFVYQTIGKHPFEDSLPLLLELEPKQCLRVTIQLIPASDDGVRAEFPLGRMTLYFGSQRIPISHMFLMLW